jgi:hypothetical protein
MIPDCTLVTACYDLTKYHTKSRNMQESINNMKSLLETPCYLVIFINDILYNSIYKIRNELNLIHLTKFIVKEFEDLNVYKYVDIVKTNREKYHPTKDERTCAESHLICCSKFDFMLEAINLNPFNTTKFGWIDSNVGNNFSKICLNYKNNMLLKILNNSTTDKFHLQILNVTDKRFSQSENLREYYNQYRWVVCGSFFLVGNKELGNKILNELNDVFIKTTNSGYGHGEEMFYLEILDKYYDDINRSYGDYKDIINNFLSINTSENYIYICIIKNYANYGYNRECYECCKKLITSFENYDIEINYNIYFLTLFQSYIASYYLDKILAKNIVDKILLLINENPYIKLEYNKNKDFYDSQFKYVM